MNLSIIRLALGLLLSLVTLSPLWSQEADQTLRVTHIFSWRKHLNNAYIGFSYGHQSGVWKLSPLPDLPGAFSVDAHYYIISESRRDTSLTEKPIDQEVSSHFTWGADGSMRQFSGQGLPYYIGYPASPPPSAGVGTVWSAPGELAADFLHSGKTTRVPILVEYQWEGEGTFLGSAVVQVKAQFALRYKSGLDPAGDATIDRIEGTHIATISYRKSDLKPIFIREKAVENLQTVSGQRWSNEGAISSFFEGVAPLAIPALTVELTQKLQNEAVPEVKIQEDPRGVKLTLENLRFIADQAILLPGESDRLAKISMLLKTVPDRSLLVVGHTAAVGSQASQDSLSVARALAIVNRLKELGIPASRLLYEGRGGRDPIADNSTEPGRALNRRVEIFILDQ